LSTILGLELLLRTLEGACKKDLLLRTSTACTAERWNCKGPVERTCGHC
jgi:hypothetical protein